MTDQTSIDRQKSARAGQSLFERAEQAFGSTGLAPAPVPRGLEGRRAPRVPARPMRIPEPALAGERPVASELAETRIDFGGDRQPINRAHLRTGGLIVPDGPVSGLLEEFRIVKRHVLLSARDARRRGVTGAAQRVLICSPLPEEGKTFTATNLALAIAAEKDTEVVLVDADFAKPSVLDLLGLHGETGLLEALAEPERRIEDSVIATDIEGLFVLPGGRSTGTDSEFLSSERTARVLDRLTQGAPDRIVIFDSPPALAASPAADLARHTAQAVMVVRAGRTGESAIDDALSLLSACPDIKLLLNDAHFSPSGRRFGAYYGSSE